MGFHTPFRCQTTNVYFHLATGIKHIMVASPETYLRIRAKMRIIGAVLSITSQIQRIGEFVIMCVPEKIVRNIIWLIYFQWFFLIELNVKVRNMNSLMFFRAPILFDLQDWLIVNSRIKQCSSHWSSVANKPKKVIYTWWTQGKRWREEGVFEWKAFWIFGNQNGKN